MTQLSFFVAGIPVTQGGMRAVGNPGTGRPVLITTGGKGLNQWRKHVHQVAELAMLTQQWETCTGPVEVAYRFLIPMPASRPASLRRQLIAPSTVRPDLDKLVRAIGDSLTSAKVYGDDCQIFMAHTSKYEVTATALAGVEVVVATHERTASDTMLKLLDRRQLAARSR